MASLLAFWAKLGAHTYPDRYHPVLCHLIDVGFVARQAGLCLADAWGQRGGQGFYVALTTMAYREQGMR
jgi:hypothetical protein